MGGKAVKIHGGDAPVAEGESGRGRWSGLQGRPTGSGCLSSCVLSAPGAKYGTIQCPHRHRCPGCRTDPRRGHGPVRLISGVSGRHPCWTEKVLENASREAPLRRQGAPRMSSTLPPTRGATEPANSDEAVARSADVRSWVRCEGPLLARIRLDHTQHQCPLTTLLRRSECPPSASIDRAAALAWQ